MNKIKELIAGSRDKTFYAKDEIMLPAHIGVIQSGCVVVGKVTAEGFYRPYRFVVPGEFLWPLSDTAYQAAIFTSIKLVSVHQARLMQDYDETLTKEFAKDLRALTECFVATSTSDAKTRVRWCLQTLFDALEDGVANPFAVRRCVFGRRRMQDGMSALLSSMADLRAETVSRVVKELRHEFT